MDGTRTYFLTADPQDANRRFLHTEGCQVRQNHIDDVVEIGAYVDCEAALAEVHKEYPRANACALCCPACHIPHQEIERGDGAAA